MTLWLTFATHAEAASVVHALAAATSVTVSCALEREFLPRLPLLRPLRHPPLHHYLEAGSPFSVPTSFVRATSFAPYLPPPIKPDMHSMPHSPIGLGFTVPGYTLSTNPPAPKNSFRSGDWLCPSVTCGAHNFGRNSTCYGCGALKPIMVGRAAEAPQMLSAPPPRTPALPRFLGSAPQSPGFPSHFPLSPGLAHGRAPVPSPLSAPVSPSVRRGPVPSYSLLTPSGRAFASGGRVRNVSTAIGLSCVMFWPDNEALPEPGQIRPPDIVHLQHPPILNTGNRGPIEHQPGDWICHKCNYLNWRRRKVCQTCFPYAEGNGDSISAAVQAERINLLASLLAHQASLDSPVLAPTMAPPSSSRPARSCSNTPPLRHPFPAAMLRSRSHMELSTNYANGAESTIYQTSGHTASPTPSGMESPLAGRFHPSLQDGGCSRLASSTPSLLQDITEAPALSPTSSCSADLASLEEHDEYHSPPLILSDHVSYDVSASGKPSPASSVPLGSIWGFDGHERKTFLNRTVGSRSAFDPFGSGN